MKDEDDANNLINAPTDAFSDLKRLLSEFYEVLNKCKPVSTLFFSTI